MSSSSDPSEPNADAGSDRRNALLIGVVAVLAAVAVIVAVVVATGDDDDGAGGCIADLARRLPSELDVGVVEGADLVAAREHGYDDSSRESRAETFDLGIRPDPVTWQVLVRMFDLDPDAMPYEPADVECWVGTQGQFVAQGEFDADRVAGTEQFGEMLVVSDDGRLLATDESYLDAPDGDEPNGLARAIDALGDDAVQVTLMAAVDGGETSSSEWIGSGLAPEGSTRWTATMVWAYDDAVVAEDAEPLLRDLLRDESQLSEYVAGDPSDLLERDGSVLSFRSRVVGGPSDWMQLYIYMDAALVFDPRVAPDE